MQQTATQTQKGGIPQPAQSQQKERRKRLEETGWKFRQNKEKEWNVWRNDPYVKLSRISSLDEALDRAESHQNRLDENPSKPNFPFLSEENQEQVKQYEKQGWNIFQDEKSHLWNAYINNKRCTATLEDYESLSVLLSRIDVEETAASLISRGIGANPFAHFSEEIQAQAKQYVEAGWFILKNDKGTWDAKKEFPGALPVEFAGFESLEFLLEQLIRQEMPARYVELREAKNNGDPPTVVIGDVSRFRSKGDNENKKDGDIRASYSAQTIAESQKVRKTFVHDAKQYVSIGGVSGAIIAYEIVSPADYKGEIFTYYTKPNGQGYEGVRVKWKSNDVVLTNPVKFVSPDVNKWVSAGKIVNPPLFSGQPGEGEISDGKSIAEIAADHSLIDRNDEENDTSLDEVVAVHPAKWLEAKNAVNTSLLTRSVTGGRKKEPVKNLIIENEGKYFVFDGASWGSDGDFILGHEVVPENLYEGETTLPEEWEKRGVFNFKGVRVFGKDDNFYVTVKRVKFKEKDEAFDEKLAELETRFIEARKERNDALFNYLTTGETEELVLIYARKQEKYATAEGDLRAYLREKGREDSADYLLQPTEDDVRDRAKKFLAKQAELKRLETPRVEVITKELVVELTEEEKRIRTDQLLEKEIQIRDSVERFKTIQTEHKANIKFLTAEREKLFAAAHSGKEFREVSCEQIFDYKAQTVTVVRCDTGERIKSRRMSSEELQIALPGVEETEGGEEF